MILISHRRHLEHLNPADEDTLVVSTDWLAWRQFQDRGGHCLHIEHTLGDWPEEMGDPDDLFLRHCNWMYLDGRDVTLFKGVSLGKQFNAAVGFLARTYGRMYFGLDRFCRTFRPDELVLYDLRAEYDILDEETRRAIVEEVTAEHGITVVDRWDPPEPGNPGFPEIAYTGFTPAERGFKPFWRSLYGLAIDTVFRLRSGPVADKPRVFFVLNWIVIDSLLAHYRDQAVAPVILAEQCPKNIGFVWRCWRQGVLLAGLPVASLSAAERAGVEAIVERLEAAWAKPASGLEAARRRLVRGMIASGRFHERAAEIKRYDRLFRHHRFARVVLGDAGNALNRLLAELAVREGRPANELLNGMFMTRQRLDARVGDGHRLGLISLLLCWGAQNEAWLKATGADIDCVRTGYPALDRILAQPKSAPGRRERALVLPLTVDSSDMRGLRGHIFTYLVETLRALEKAGVREMRIKIHPGTPQRAYYDAVLGHFGLPYPVYKEGGLGQHLAWADFVVGPVNSGAFVETLAAGKPYFPMRPEPSSVDPALCGIAPILNSPRDLAAMLENGEMPDRDAILGNLCSFGEIANASDRVWDVLSKPTSGKPVEATDSFPTPRA